MKILVTGGCGYIGSHTIVDLLLKGYEVVSLDNFSRGKRYVPERIKQITGKDFINEEVELCDEAATRAIFIKHSGIDGIIDFAAYKMVGESVANPLLYYRNNLVSLINLLQCVQEFQIANFLFSSSSSAYGNVEKLPVQEDTPVTKQESPYGRTKFFGEHIIADAVNASPFNALILRYFNPAGSHESALLGEPFDEKPMNLVPAITRTAIGFQKKFIVHGIDYPTRDGSCIRDYIHVMDVAEAHTQALQYLMLKKNISPEPEIINLGTGNGVSVLEMITAFEQATGEKLNYHVGPRRTGDAIAVYSENTKAENLLHWKPRRSLEEMMKSAWEWEKELLKSSKTEMGTAEQA
ncbi:MAG: UDP-glucose 4-epimerase GalE [Chitinophagales bacterium]|nr:UDP-glucose 4-epimerase GalE [Chitinophagales bacterium]